MTYFSDLENLRLKGEKWRKYISHNPIYIDTCFCGNEENRALRFMRNVHR